MTTDSPAGSPDGSDLDFRPKLPRDRSPGIGCVGAGFVMADCHLVAYRQAGFRPVAIASRTRANAEAVAKKRGVPRAYDDLRKLLEDPEVSVLDVAVPPDRQFDVVRTALEYAGKIRGILAQKPLGTSFTQARELVERCEEAGVKLVVNQNMRYDPSIRACKTLLDRNALGEPVLATIDMRAIPHWMEWQERQGWVTLRIMSIHHLDSFRFLFGDPERVYCSVRPDPRTSRKFAHDDGIALYVLEYKNGLRCSAWDDVWAGPAREGAASDLGIRWRVEGTDGIARGTIGWPDYPKPTPSTLDYSTIATGDAWLKPRWSDVWFPDAFAGPMAELLCALEDGTTPNLNGRDNLGTMALVGACYVSACEKRAVEIGEVMYSHEF